MSKPEIQELDQYLGDLVKGWERFALHLPGIDQADIDVIKENSRDDVVDRKMTLYKKWLRVFPSASWSDVIQALEKVKENTIASSLRSKFPVSQTTAMSPKKPKVHTEKEEVTVQHREIVQRLTLILCIVKKEYIILTLALE